MLCMLAQPHVVLGHRHRYINSLPHMLCTTRMTGLLVTPLTTLHMAELVIACQPCLKRMGFGMQVLADPAGSVAGQRHAPPDYTLPGLRAAWVRVKPHTLLGPVTAERAISPGRVPHRIQNGPPSRRHVSLMLARAPHSGLARIQKYCAELHELCCAAEAHMLAVPVAVPGTTLRPATWSWCGASTHSR